MDPTEYFAKCLDMVYDSLMPPDDEPERDICEHTPCVCEAFIVRYCHICGADKIEDLLTPHPLAPEKDVCASCMEDIGT